MATTELPQSDGEISTDKRSTLTASKKTEINKHTTSPPAARRERAPLHRTRSIDDFYSDAHGNSGASAKEILLLLRKRILYYFCFMALALVNIGNTAATTSIGFLFAYESYKGISQGQQGVIASSYYFGACLGGIIGGSLSDIVGRRPILLAGVSLNSVFGILSAFVDSSWTVAFCRVIVGFGVGVTMPSVSTLASEHSPPGHRGGYSNFVNAFWTLGGIYSASMALLLLRDGLHWRYYAISVASPSILALPLVYACVPESSRFLGLHGKYKSAQKQANRIARSMSFRGEPLSLAEIESQYPRSSTREFSPTISHSLKKVTQAYVDLYKDSKIRMKVLLCQTLWFLIFVGYGVSYWIALVFSELSFVDNVYLLTLYFNVAAIPGLLLCGWMIDKFPRMHLLRGGLFSAIVSLIACAYFSMATKNTTALLIATCLFNSTLATCWAALSLATTESFSTDQRSGATGVCTAAGKFGFIVLSFSTDLFLRRDLPSGPLLLGSVSFLCALLLTFSGIMMTAQGGSLEDIVNNDPSSKKLVQGTDKDKVDCSSIALFIKEGVASKVDPMEDSCATLGDAVSGTEADISDSPDDDIWV